MNKEIKNGQPVSVAHRIIKGLVREIIIPVAMALIVIQFVIQAFKIPSSSMEDSLLIGDFLLGLKFSYGSPMPFSENKFPGLSDPQPGDILIFRYPGEPEYPDYNRDRYSHVANLLMLGNYYWDHDASEGQSSLIHYVEGPKDFIKRCVAKSGQTLYIREGHLFVDSVEQKIPGEGKYTSMFREKTVRDFYGPVRLPSAGETLLLDTLDIESLYRIKSLVVQENPSSSVEFELNLFKQKVELDSSGTATPSHQPDVLANNHEFSDFKTYAYNDRIFLINYMLENNLDPLNPSPGSVLSGKVPFSFFKELSRTGFLAHEVNIQGGIFGLINKFTRPVSYLYFYGTQLGDLVENINLNNQQESADKLRLSHRIVMDGKPLTEYTFKQDSYFMMGDNRDNSSDSRYWGFLSRQNVKAKAFIVYFSFESFPPGYAKAHGKMEFSILNPFTWFLIPFKTRWSRIGMLIHGV
jgi:signal peptidase I